MLDELRTRTESLGESLHIRERLVVAPCWGRLRTGGASPGEFVNEGQVIGHIQEAGTDTPLVCHASALFLGWSVVTGRRVSPGTKLAVLRAVD